MCQDNHRMRLTLMVVLTLAFCCFGCRKSDKESGGGNRSSASSQEVKGKFPDNVELSKTKGVSIIQCPAQNYDGLSISGDGSSSSGNAKTAPLSQIIHVWCDFEGYLFIDAELPDARYNISVQAPEGQTIWPLAKQAFEDVFGLRFVERKEMLDVVVLQKSEDSPHGLLHVKTDSPSYGTEQTSGGFGWEIRSGTMETLTDIVSKYVAEPVIDETGLTGYYKFTLAMDHWEPKTVFPAVKQLGLRLEKTKRELSVMRVVAAQPVEH